MILVDPHDAAIFSGLICSQNILDDFPETPAVLRLTNIIETLLDVHVTKVKGQHYGTKPLHKFIEECDLLISNSSEEDEEEENES